MADCEIEISGRDGGYWASMRSAAGEPDPVSVAFPFDEHALAHQLQAVELALLRSSVRNRRLTTEEERPAQELGRRLFEFALPPPLQGYFIAARQGAAEREQPLVVRLRVRPPELAALPWEFLYDPSQDDYLALRSPLVRFLDTPTPHRVLEVRAPLRILAMTASPHELDRLEVEEEQRRLTEALAGLQASGQVELGWVGGQSWWDLQAALDQGGWHVFHFIGHSGFDTYLGEGVLALAGEDGGLHRFPASDLAPMLAEQPSLRLVVLNSCDSARASATDRFSSTASVLMRRGIPAVVAMQFEISDQAAIAFARGFYTAIAAQHPVDQAVSRGRRAIKHARQNTLDWATPVLYLRSATGALFTLTDRPAPDTPRAPASTPEPRPPKPAPDLTAPAPPPRGSLTPAVEQLRLTHEDTVGGWRSARTEPG